MAKTSTPTKASHVPKLKPGLYKYHGYERVDLPVYKNCTKLTSGLYCAMSHSLSNVSFSKPPKIPHGECILLCEYVGLGISPDVELWYLLYKADMWYAWIDTEAVEPT